SGIRSYLTLKGTRPLSRPQELRSRQSLLAANGRLGRQTAGRVALATCAGSADPAKRGDRAASQRVQSGRDSPPARGLPPQPPARRRREESVGSRPVAS